MLSALEIHSILKEIKPLVGAKVDKIFHPDKEEVLLQLHSGGKHIVRIIAGKMLYLASFKPSLSEPSGFCKYLRKKLGNARLKAVEQKGFERVVEFVFETKDGMVSFIIELFGKGNIILVKDGLIMTALSQQQWKDRSVMPGKEYIYPKKEFNFLTLSQTQLKDLLGKSDKENIVKTLAIDLGLGGKVAESTLLQAGIDKNISPGEIKNSEKLFLILNNLKDKQVITSAELDDKSLKEVTEVLEVESKEVTKLKNIITQQEKKLASMSKEIELNKNTGDTIYEHYTQLKQIIDEINKLSKKMSLQEMKKKLKKHKVIKDIIPFEKAIIVEV